MAMPFFACCTLLLVPKLLPEVAVPPTREQQAATAAMQADNPLLVCWTPVGYTMHVQSAVSTSLTVLNLG